MSALWLPVAIGLAFGAALERAGLGNARKLTGQFYLTDFTVFKVMFTAIVTAMLGAFWLGRLGLIDIDSIYVPETYLVPQLAGGLLFGVGFLVSGLCPGTSCVAAASGRLDGLATVGGLLVGVIATGFAVPALPSLFDTASGSVWQLPEVLHVPYGVVVLLVVLMALGGFALAERLERA